MSGTADEELERCQERVGTTLRNSWRLDGLIGVGGMAAVYAATHTTGTRSAIKILHPEIAVSRELRARFEQEALAVNQLGHPATVQVDAIDIADDGAPFMVMELLDGESLGQLAYRQGEVPERQLLGYMTTVLEVLHAAHQRGIVHRDVKPDNLFITSDGRVKVLDFGIARMRDGGSTSVRTRTGAMLGTTSYMAPEQIHARPIDGRADVFALGASMFRILAKQKIHPAESDAELLMKMGGTPAPKLRTVAPQIDLGTAMIVDRALTFDRDQRYPDAATMLRDVQAVLANQPPPYATRAALHTDSATRAEGSRTGAPTALAAISQVGPTQPGDPTPAWSAAAGPAPWPAVTRSQARSHGPAATSAAWGSPIAVKEQRESKIVGMPVLFGIGGLLLVAGGIGVAMLMGECGTTEKRKAAAAQEEDGVQTVPARTAAQSPSAASASTSPPATTHASQPPRPRPTVTAPSTSRPTETATSRPLPTVNDPALRTTGTPSTRPTTPAPSVPTSRPTAAPTTRPTADPSAFNDDGKDKGKKKKDRKKDDDDDD